MKGTGMHRPLLWLVLLASVSAFGQTPQGPPASVFSLSGTWAPYFHEDLLERGNGPELDNYVGLPITNGARKMALSWDPSRMTVEEHQVVLSEISTPSIKSSP